MVRIRSINLASLLSVVRLSATSRCNESPHRNSSAGAEQVSNARLIIHRHVQIAARDADVAVARGVAHLGQRPPAGQRGTDERVPAVVNRERLKPGGVSCLRLALR
jgi:hypothetical protein